MTDWATDWAAMLRAARAAGVSPEAFWRLSLREWRWLIAVGGAAPLGRGELERLMEGHPDD
ncbi:phage tail assembly chaperone [Brevundimonas balnearis]|uniref:Phage tail assembly chaperone n=1 Tax=Brevundimonas balnearis TaxID=1572858 RepID=A0ABV6R5I8_9CAUL